jgi:hypothetical protein
MLSDSNPKKGFGHGRDVLLSALVGAAVDDEGDDDTRRRKGSPGLRAESALVSTIVGKCPEEEQKLCASFTARPVSGDGSSPPQMALLPGHVTPFTLLACTDRVADDGGALRLPRTLAHAPNASAACAVLPVTRPPPRSNARA